ncbi:Beta-carbonic anhydrase 1 [Cladobotryum mycophilum]|uniref:Carbonic anhydrase n=1 Tax=Cladobotryum mycophilum TaxID=491253 RepID=A0ABR0SCC6_9HYPO
MSVAIQLEAANKQYEATFTKAGLPMPPGRKVFILTCMDARLDPAKFLGLEEGDAHVFRNAGGRAVEALRSLVISQQLLGTREIIVIHHTDCGMLTFHDEELRAKIQQDLGEDAGHISFLSIRDLQESVKDDVGFLKRNPLLLDVPISGYIYDVKTGKINRVPV